MDQNNQKLADLIPAEIKTYLEGVLLDAKMITDDKDMNDALLEELYARLSEFINARIAEEMPEEKVESFTKLLEEKKSPQEIDAYIAAAVPNLNEIYSDAFLEFRDLYLGQGEYVDIAQSPEAVNTKYEK